MPSSHFSLTSFVLKLGTVLSATCIAYFLLRGYEGLFELRFVDEEVMTILQEPCWVRIIKSCIYVVMEKREFLRKG